MSKAIVYPFIPDGKEIQYVGADNPYMELAKGFAQRFSLDKSMPGAAVVVRDGKILGIGANGSDYHERCGCQRVRLGCRTGEGYELCEGCHPRNHSESSALRDAHEDGYDVTGADLYLWGHFWCCQPCWEAMSRAGIKNVFLLEDSEVLFNREDPGNVIGHQFD